MSNLPDEEKLRGFVERIEAIRRSKKQLGLDEKEVLTAAEAAGLNKDGLLSIVKVRSTKPAARAERNAILDAYLHAMGLADEPPLFRALKLLERDDLSRNAVLERLKGIAPESGDIILRAGGEPVRIFRDHDGVAQVEPYLEPEQQSDLEDFTGKGGKGKRKKSELPPEIEALDDEGAEDLGRTYGRENRPIVDNPFEYGDTRRADFERGWIDATGSDGMGPPVEDDPDDPETPADGDPTADEGDPTDEDA